MKGDYEPIEELPPIGKAFLKVMERVFPIRSPEPSTTQREDLYYAGQQSVLAFLRKAMQDQIDRQNE
jgi:hypothetical protein